MQIIASLRYSVLNEDTPNEWEMRIDYEEESEIYFVYATMDRASVMGRSSFRNYEEAKNKFFEKLDITVQLNRRAIERRETPE